MNATVLIVDDDEGCRALAAQVLQREGYVLNLAGSGEEALLRVEKAWPDVVLLDIRLPGIDGLETYHRLQQMAASKQRSLQVVVMTASAMPSDLQRLRSVGLDEYLLKPCDLQDLRDAVRRKVDFGAEP